MNKKLSPLTKNKSVLSLLNTTLFHIYDEKAYVDNVRKLIKAFDWAYDFKIFCRQGYAEPYIMRLLQKEGVGATAVPGRTGTVRQSRHQRP